MQSLCIRQLEERLAQLPAEISEGISPAAIAAKLTESLRQQFVASGIPETAQALAVISKQTKQVAGEFDRSSKQLTDSYRGAASEARRALDEIRGSIEYATATAKQAAHDLTHTFLREYKWSVLVLCSVALAVGFALGILVLPLDQFSGTRTNPEHGRCSIKTRGQQRRTPLRLTPPARFKGKPTSKDEAAQ